MGRGDGRSLDTCSFDALREICAEVAKVAILAGNTIAERVDSLSGYDTKGLHDFVTEVDKASETIIVSHLTRLYPEIGILSEEGGGRPLENGYNWIIDPLDGTTNFIHGLPPFAVSIGLARGTELLLGVVHEVTQAETFTAVRGGGAFCNGKPIAATTCASVEDALVATGFPYYDYSRLPQFMQTLEYFMQHSHGMRRLGSAATDLVYVACGRVDAFYEYGLHPWDVAAGLLIAQEAGALYSDYEGGTSCLYSGEIICAAKGVFPEFQGLIRRFMTH